MKVVEFKGIIHSDPEIMGGTPVFIGTGVSLQNLIGYKGGGSVEDFLAAFPFIKRHQIITVVEAGTPKI